MSKKAIQWRSERREVKKLVHFEKNPRSITPAAMEKLKDRIRKRGFHDVLKVDIDGTTVLSGNMRRDALEQLGIEDVTVLIPSRALTDEERDAIVLESNRNDGEWNDNVLASFSDEVLIESGFPSSEVDTILSVEEDDEDDFDTEERVKEIKKPTAKPGDLYQMGEHRLLCGDSTSQDDVTRLMGGKKADMVFTEPPYNMNYVSHDKGGIMNDNMSETAFVEFSEKFITRMKESCKAGAAYYICSGYNSYPTFMYALTTQGLTVASMIVWVKNSLGMGMNDYRHKHELVVKTKAAPKRRSKKGEPILYGWNGGKHYFADTHSEADVWEVSKRATNTMSHPTQKPIALVNRAIKNSTRRGGLVLDLFGGSGSTLVAAHKTGRAAYLMELDPKYADGIIARWEALTGLKANKV